jgi:hypothetical protein
VGAAGGVATPKAPTKIFLKHPLTGDEVEVDMTQLVPYMVKGYIQEKGRV